MSESKLGAYSSKLSSGFGALQETRDFLRLWTPGMTPKALVDTAVRQGIFGEATERRIFDQVHDVFAPRYMIQEGRPARQLQALLSAGCGGADFAQICYLHTCRVQVMLREFVLQVYWDYARQRATTLERAAAMRFIHQGLDTGRMPIRWSDNTIKNNAGFLLSTCVEFGLLQRVRPGVCQLTAFDLRPKVFAYLAHDLHFSGVSDSDLVAPPDWQLFGLVAADVHRRLGQGQLDDDALYQYGAGLTTLSWRHATMDAFLHALAQR